MKTLTPISETQEIQGILERAVSQAIEGTLEDAMRVRLYQFALTIAAGEFHRIESTNGGSVAPEVLLLIQQISLLCSENPDPRKFIRLNDAPHGE